MRLQHVHVEGCGRFLQPVKVSGLERGLNVLAAPNEAGKSTLFKAVRACVFQKHTARGEDLRDLATQGASVPLTIEVGFEHEGHEYMVRKTFLSSPRASVIRDGKEIAAGRAADEEIYTILGLQPGSGRSVDEGAFGMLWVAQSKSFAPPEVEGAVKDSIEGAIEREVGSLVGGDRARELMKKLSDELATLYTATGQVKKSGALGLAQDREEAAGAELTQTRGLLAALERDTDELERARNRRSELADPKNRSELSANLSKAREDYKTAQEAAREVANRAQAERLAAAERDAAARSLKDLRETAAKIDTAFDARAKAVEEAESALAAEKNLAGRRDQARTRLAELEDADARDAQAYLHLRNLAAVAVAMSGLPDLEARLALLTQSADQLAAVRGTLASIRATDRHVHALDKIETELSQLAARLDAAAAQVTVTPAQEASTAIEVDGQSITRPVEFPATRRTTLNVPGVGEIVIAPPAAFGETERKRMAELEAARLRTVADAGAENPEGVHALVGERVKRETELSGLAAKLAALQSSEATLASDMAALREKVSAARASIRQTLGQDETALDARLIAEKQDALDNKRRENAAARKALQSEIDTIGEELTRCAGAIAKQRAEIAALDREIESGLRALPQAERASRIASAAETFDRLQRTWETADLALEQARKDAPDDERIEQLAGRVKRLEAAQANQASDLTKIENTISELTGRIQARGGEGLGERVAALTEDHALAQRDAERIRARAESLKLLRDTIESCYEEQREQLQAPIRKRLQPFLNDLFPRAELTLDESFAIQRIVRAGASESFERLSDGTREQIAVLVRLAMGTLLHERGEDLPIILDDALVFCDDDRIELMFDALNRAARTQQVIVLTCRGKSFRTLGGKALAIEAAAPLR